MKRVSFALTSEELLAAMHFNEMKNVKSRYETLFNAIKRQLIKTKDETKSVENNKKCKSKWCQFIFRNRTGVREM